MEPGQLRATCKGRNVGPYLTPCTRSNSDWITDLSVRAEPIQLLDEDIGVKFHGLGLVNCFLDILYQKLKQSKTDKLDFIRIKNFGVSKDIINRVKRALAGVPQWIKCQPANQRVAS